jgi:hypothetical protein
MRTFFPSKERKRRKRACFEILPQLSSLLSDVFPSLGLRVLICKVGITVTR